VAASDGVDNGGVAGKGLLRLLRRGWDWGLGGDWRLSGGWDRVGGQGGDGGVSRAVLRNVSIRSCASVDRSEECLQ
jgi:hypothetical protein